MNAPSETLPMGSLPATQQFGVSLLYMRILNEGMVNGIPPVVRQCIEYLSTPEALETVVTYRLSTNKWIIAELKNKSNLGINICFGNRPHIAATLLMNFFKDLKEPLLTYKLYNDIIYWTFGCYANRPQKLRCIVSRLPVDNYILFKYLMFFLWKVKERCSVNKMNINTLSVVFGPLLAWPRVGTRSFQDIVRINSFLAYLLTHYETIFIY